MEKSLLRDGSGLGIRSEYDSERTKYSHFQTLNSATDSDHQNALSASVSRIKMQYRLQYSHQIWHHCSLSVPIFSLDACNSLLPSEYAIQTLYILASTLKVLKGLALRGGYCHEPEYFHYIITILISIMDLTVCFPPNYYSYPFCTAQYGLTIF